MLTKVNLELLLQNTKDIALKRRARWLITKLNPKNGENILDVGCGDGYYLYMLSSLNSTLKLTGVDFDPKALRSARKNVGRNIKLIRAEGDDRDEAKQGVMWAIIALFLLVSIWGIVKFLRETVDITGTDTVTVPKLPLK